MCFLVLLDIQAQNSGNRLFAHNKEIVLYIRVLYKLQIKTVSWKIKQSQRDYGQKSNH